MDVCVFTSLLRNQTYEYNMKIQNLLSIPLYVFKIAQFSGRKSCTNTANANSFPKSFKIAGWQIAAKTLEHFVA